MELTKINAPAVQLKLSRQLKELVKRSFDIFVSAVVLALLAPVFGLIGLAIRRDSPGPAFYRGPRMGRYGKPFGILKFRTMYERPESYQGPRVTAQDDPRVTRLGHWLRETKLNELPQFWNVLKGEMSLVGPRPEDPDIAKLWSKEIFNEVLSVRPGITSPASVQYRNEESLLSAGSVMQKYLEDLAPDKMRLDQLYVRNRSFWLDLDVLLWTALVFLPKIRAYTPPEELLFVGPATRLFRRYMRWFSIDLLVTFIAIGITGLIWRVDAPLNIGWPRAIAGAIGFSLLFSVTGALMGMNHIAWSQASNRDVFDLFPAWMVATLIGFLANHATGVFPSGLFLMASGLALIGYIIVRFRSRLFTGFLSRVLRNRGAARAARERVLIVGSGPTAQLTTWLLDHPANANRYKVVGMVDNDLFKQGMRIFGVPVLGASKDLPRLIADHDVGVIILADQRIAEGEGSAIIARCQVASARLLVLPDIFATLNDAVVDAPIQQPDDQAVQLESSKPACAYCLARLAQLDYSLTSKN
jgi:lipopolysaccharide/colanic/teichoic acid biosynthesis glycosyltransferase